jgi:hypothetical protein
MAGRVISSIGEGKSQGGARTWNVPDESGEPQAAPDMQEVTPEQINAIRSKFMERGREEAQGKLSDAKKRVELLIGVGRRTRDVFIDVDGKKTKFSLRTLKGSEQRLLSQVIERSERASLPGGRIIFTPTSIYDIRQEALKHSLFQIDGVDVDLILGCDNQPIEVRLEQREVLLNEMDDALTAHLFTEYEKLSRETADGYGVKNEKDAKEVAEAIRKSST